ncbi:MAG: carbohydrate binding family 9 domain-containing protein [Bacteroidetes bacterium]|nr:carbohydrate binding family 9 domain-containing protein [Bacteroidota bacterium]
MIRCAVLVVVAAAALNAAQVKAVKLSQPVAVDGRLTEAVWSIAPAVTEFTQREPNQGTSPSERSEVWVAYDDDALYIAARLYDSSPDSIMALLDRRDNLSTADWFGVFLDPYRDKRSGNYFVLGPSGTMADGVLYNDDWDDDDWDGVWEGRSSIDEKGWTVEMRIPFSQLRFTEKDQQVWGINFRRDIGRRNETSYLVYTPRMESGYVSRFPELVGIEGIKPANALEILPFMTTKAEFTHPAPGDPFNNGSRYTPEAGADLRYGLSSNLILIGTVNPDFGQVEVDPAVVNLSDVESFFSEKRPFFVEGANIFTNYGQGGGRNFWNFNFPYTTPFYSRRIGRSPHGNDTLGGADFYHQPFATRILGAGKVTGKVGDGWNVGTIHAVTAREFADYKVGTLRSEAEVEPSTYYGVGRVQRDFNDGRQGLGILGTYTHREFSDQSLRSGLNNSGSFVGLDGWTFLDTGKTWVVTGYTNLSHVEGTRERMTALQRNSQHYFQRPDASHVDVDTNATSMTGLAGRFYLIKQQGNFFFNSSLGFIDPKYEVNDLGFQSRADVINMHAGGGYNWSEPDGLFRRKELGGGFGQSFDFQKNLIHRVLVHFGFVQFMNYYSINWNFAVNPTTTLSNRRTRGGPLTVNPKGWEINLNASSDYSKEVVVEMFGYTYQSGESDRKSAGFWIQYRPAPNVNLSIGPDFTDEVSKVAYGGGDYADPTANLTFGRRYLFSELAYKEISANIRLNWTFTPTLSLQLYMQPLLSSGRYSNFKQLVRPSSAEYLVYGTSGSTITKSGSDYTVDPDGAGAGASYTFSDPNFNFKSLRGNAVLRWEYLPGSALYFVWTQNRSDFENIGEMELGRSIDRLVSAKADNIFLMKMSYYFNM